MRTASRVIVFSAAAFLLFGCTCLAADVIRVDPNTPEAAAVSEEPQDFWADKRLEQTVDYEAKMRPVREILDELAKLTGVKLNAGYNFNDWQVRDRRMVIVAKDLPLKELMQSVARVMKFKWSRSERDGVWTYRLWMDRKTLLGEEAQRYREEQLEEEYVSKQRSKLLDVMDKSAQFTEKELAEMKESDPYSYALVKSGVGAAMADVMRGAPEVRQALVTGGELQVSGESMSSEAREALVRLAMASSKLQFDEYRRTSEPLFSSISGYTDSVDITANEFVKRIQRSDPLRRSFLGDMTIQGVRPPEGDETTGYSFTERLTLLNPGGNIANLYGRLSNRVMDGETSVDSAKAELNSQQSQVLAAERTNTDWGEPLAEHPEDPGLERVVKFELPKYKRSDGVEYEQRGYDDILGAMVKATGMSVVSDYFDPPLGIVAPHGVWKSEARIVDALTYIEQSYVSNWWKHDKVIDVRDRGWFRKRAMQVPDEWIERWIGELKSKGYIEIENLAQICCLSQEQFHYSLPLSYSIDYLDSVYSHQQANPWLRFYASLSKYQKGALLQSGLDARSLSGMQWSKLNGVDAALQPEGVALFKAERAENTLPVVDSKMKEICKRKEISYKFSALTEDGSVAWELEVPIPTQREPEVSE